MTHKPPTIDDLNATAQATNDAVRQEAIERGELLPVWKDGRVVLVWPAVPGRRREVSLALLVRELVKRQVVVTNQDIEVLVAGVFADGDVELPLAESGRAMVWTHSGIGNRGNVYNVTDRVHGKQVPAPTPAKIGA